MISFSPGRTITTLLTTGIAILLVACDNQSDPAPTSTPTLQPQPGNTITPPPRRATNTPAIGGGAADPTAGASVQEMDTYLQSLTEQGAFSGSVLVARAGEVLLSQGYGMADAEKGVPNTPQTTYQLASLSKAFAAMSIMILEERGKLSVQDTLCKFHKDCPAAWEAITLHHLLTHTSGIPSGDNLIDFNTADPTYEEGLATIRDMPLLFEPGKSYSYSNAGYIALGYIIEQTSGMKYERFVRENIYAPLGMSASGAVNGETAPRNMATGYHEPGKPSTFVVRPLIYAAGGLYSTIEDLYKWDQALYTENLVARKTLERVFTPFLGDYGYGWNIQDGPFGKSITHGGHIEGFRTHLSRYPDRQMTIIVLSNNELADAEGVASELAFLISK